MSEDGVSGMTNSYKFSKFFYHILFQSGTEEVSPVIRMMSLLGVLFCLRRHGDRADLLNAFR